MVRQLQNVPMLTSCTVQHCLNWHVWRVVSSGMLYKEVSSAIMLIIYLSFRESYSLLTHLTHITVLVMFSYSEITFLTYNLIRELGCRTKFFE